MILLNKLKNLLFKYIRIFRIAKIKKKDYLFVVFLTFLTVLLDAVGIGLLLPIGEYILNYETGKLPDTYSWKILKNIFLYFGLNPNITLVAAGAVLLIIFRQSIVFFRAIFIDIIRYRAVKDFRKKLFVKFLKQDLYFIKQHSTGTYNNIINLEVDNVGKAIVLPLENISGFILIFSYLILMVLVSVEATITVITCMILIGFFLKNILKYIEKTAANIIKINNNFSQNLVDRLIGIKLIRISNKIKKEESNNKNILDEQFLNNIKLSKIQRIIDSTIEPILLMVAIPVIIIAINLNFSLAKLGVFIILLARFIPIFKIIITTIQSHFAFHASIENMLNLINKVDGQREIRKGKINFPKKCKTIKFKNVFFNYENTKESALKNFSCEIKGGKINAIIGISGSGKTTIVNMIPRLLCPSKGKIYINNLDLNLFDAKKIREACVFIEQKPIFIRGSIIEHICYNNDKLDYKIASQAAKLANAHNFIMKLENNYDHKLGEGGIGLSGGQLQRLDITRGIASNKDIMILDEPTSNLDDENTKDILKTLKKINKVRKITVIVVSHDTEILKYCDNVIKL